MELSAMYEYAARHKLRFPYKGQVSVEDLWDLSVTHLDEIFKVLNAQAKAAQEESLLNRSTENEALSVQIGLVRHIVEEKLAMADARKVAEENRRKKQRIMEAIADKEADAIKSMSVEDLQKMLAEME